MTIKVITGAIVFFGLSISCIEVYAEMKINVSHIPENARQFMGMQVSKGEQLQFIIKTTYPDLFTYLDLFNYSIKGVPETAFSESI